jgi:hypothetical protein
MSKAQPREDVHESEVKFYCESGHKLREVWLYPMDLREWSRRVKFLGKCPVCGAKTFLGWKEEGGANG